MLFSLASSSNWSPQKAKRNEINRSSKKINTKQTGVNHGRIEGQTSIMNSTKRINVFEPDSLEKDYTLLDLNSMKYEESLFGDSHLGQAMLMSEVFPDEGNAKEKIGAKPANIFISSKKGTPKAALKPTGTTLITRKIIEGQVDIKPTAKSNITPYAIIEQTQSVIISESFFQPTATSKFVNKDEKVFAIEEIFRKLAELASNSRNNTEVSSNNATENKYYNVNTTQTLRYHSNNNTNKFSKSQYKHHIVRLKHKVAQPLKLKGRLHSRKASPSKHEFQFETVNYDNGLIGILSKHKTKHMYPENIKFELDSNSDGNGKEHSTVIQPSHAIIVLTDDDIGTKKSKLGRSNTVMKTGTLLNYSNIPPKLLDKGKYGEMKTTKDMFELNNVRDKREGEYCK